MLVKLSAGEQETRPFFVLRLRTKTEEEERLHSQRNDVEIPFPPGSSRKNAGAAKSKGHFVGIYYCSTVLSRAAHKQVPGEDQENLSPIPIGRLVP